MKVKIEQRYLWIPMKEEAVEVQVNLYIAGIQFDEFDTRLSFGEADFYAYKDLVDYIGKVIEITVVGMNVEEDHSPFIWCDKIPEYDTNNRPSIHYTPDYGWINDPNGLCYVNETYHLFYQFNPYGLYWGNMHWGHATSKDLLHWEQKPIALYPDEEGDMFSGCAVIDEKNLLGYGANTMLLYYTSAGGRSEWSKEKGHLFTQKLAYSTDNGKTFHHSDKFYMPHIEGDNRDPKIFYHEKSEAYIMILYLAKYKFVIYRSTDLQNFTITQELMLPKMRECPDLIELAVENTVDETKYALIAADGFYQIGNFDGYKFQAETEMLTGYQTNLGYAAQSYYKFDNRRILVPWLRTADVSQMYHGMMGLPTELSIGKEECGLRLKCKPVDEYCKMEKKMIHVTERETIIDRLNGVVEVIVDIESHKDQIIELVMGKDRIKIDCIENLLTIRDIVVNLGQTKTMLFIVDCNMVEFYSKDGFIYGNVEIETLMIP